METIKIYLAGSLFSLGEREFNSRLANLISARLPEIAFILPQDYAKSIASQEGFLDKVFNNCVSSIHEADALLCILDGSDVDSGTCIEMGYAYAINKPIIGVRTDFRSSEDKGVNLMVSKICKEMMWLTSTVLTMEQLAEEISVTLKRVLIL